MKLESHPASEPPAPDPTRDYIAFTFSRKVLARRENGEVVLAYFQHWSCLGDREFECWKQDGPDGYTLDDVARWADVPEF